MTAFWQQVFALDAKCSAQRHPNNPNFRALYMRRRSQLLKEAFQSNNSLLKKQYLKTRLYLLQQQYAFQHSLSHTPDQISIHSRSNKSSSKLSTLHPKSSLSINESKVLVPTKQAEASRAIVGGTSISENYAFAGVHHIFDQHIASVVMVKFANNDRSRLCCASSDGTISLCNVTDNPPSLVMILREHEKAVTSCDWSVNNDLVVSSSLDCSIRLWDSYSGKCLRMVKDEMNLFNTNLFSNRNPRAYYFNIHQAGNSKGLVYILNISAGIYPKGGSSKIGGRILSITCDSMGNNVWAGNDKGIITSFQFDAETGKLVKKKKVIVADNRPITCLSWRAWVSREARDPTLLVNCASNILCLYRIDGSEGNLKLRKKFNVYHRAELLRSTFCPIMSFRQGACVVTGSEDSCIYFFDIEREEKPVVNKLQGHSCPVLGVSFNYDESLLATSDVQGLVIIWKRAT